MGMGEAEASEKVRVGHFSGLSFSRGVRGRAWHGMAVSHFIEASSEQRASQSQQAPRYSDRCSVRWWE